MQCCISLQIIGSDRPVLTKRKRPKSTRFSLRTTVSARKPASFWREKRDTVVMHFSTTFRKNVVVSILINNMVTVLTFFDQQKGSVTSIKTRTATGREHLACQASAVS